MTYIVDVNFNGFIGCTETYIVDADTEEEAREQALEDAMDDLSIESVEQEAE